MVCVMEVLSRFFLGVGAKIRYSMWIRSHQKAADCFDGVDWIIALMVFDWSLRKSFLFVFFCMMTGNLTS